MKEYIVCGEPFNIPEHFSSLVVLGCNATGSCIVCSAIDTRIADVRLQNVTIKKYCYVLEDLCQSSRLVQRLKSFCQLRHPNIAAHRQFFVDASTLPLLEVGRSTLASLYHMRDYYDVSLAHLIQSKVHFSVLHIQRIALSVLRALKYLHSPSIALEYERMNPFNILLQEGGDVALSCDVPYITANSSHLFSSSRIGNGESIKGIHNATSSFANKSNETSIHQGKNDIPCPGWYMAPELILNPKLLQSSKDRRTEADRSRDLWSLAILLAELAEQKPILPGKDYLHQILLTVDFLGGFQAISGILGDMSGNDGTASSSGGLVDPVVFDFLSKRNSKKDPPAATSIDFTVDFPHVEVDNQPSSSKGTSSAVQRHVSRALIRTPPSLMNLLSNLLLFNPTLRWTASQSLEHIFFDGLRVGLKEHVGGSLGGTVMPINNDIGTFDHEEFVKEVDSLIKK